MIRHSQEGTWVTVTDFGWRGGAVECLWLSAETRVLDLNARILHDLPYNNHHYYRAIHGLFFLSTDFSHAFHPFVYPLKLLIRPSMAVPFQASV